MKIAILSDDEPEEVIWEELHEDVDPDDHGLFSIVVGQGTYESGPVTDFSEIDWTVTPSYIKTQIYYGGGWKNMGSTQLWSVPYAMVADSLGGPLKKLEVEGETDDMEEALFEVRNKAGHIVFAVYNEGVRIYVSDGDAKGPKGGFAIGGFGLVKQNDQNYFFVSGDSIRAYIDSTSIKGVKGGFAIGGFNYTKGVSQEYMKVTRDSARIYIKNKSDKGPKGGFAIGGFGQTKGFNNFLNVTPDSTRIFTSDTLTGFGVGNISTGKPVNFMKLTPSNYLIGHLAGKALTTGIYNVVMGYHAGEKLTIGGGNVLFGYEAGKNVVSGTSNFFAGPSAGYNVTTARRSITIGEGSGYYFQEGEHNIYIGYAAGMGLGIGEGGGSYNVYLGSSAGYRVCNGDANVLLGDRSAAEMINGSRNVMIGALTNYLWDGVRRSADTCYDNIYIGFTAAASNYYGRRNVIIGSKANGELTPSGFTGSGNVFIGNETGYYEKGSDKLYIDNSNTSTPLIYGNFMDGSETLIFHGNVGIGTSPGINKLSISGLSGSATGSNLIISGNNVYYSTSRRDAKENIVPLKDDFNKILNTQPVSFTDKQTGNQGIGYIAEDFEKAGLHNLLIYENGELVSLKYDLISVYNLEIIKEQQSQIESQAQKNQQLRSELESLKERMAALESFLGKN